MNCRSIALTRIIDVVILRVHIVVIGRHSVRVGRIRLIVVVVVLIQIGIGGWSFILSVAVSQNVEAARGTRLLPLEPRAQAGRVEYVAAGQFLRRIHHVLSEICSCHCTLSTISPAADSTNLQMMHMLSDWANSSGVASGYRVFMLRIARRDRITSFSAFLKFLKFKKVFDEIQRRMWKLKRWRG